MALNPPAQPGLATARLDRFLAENHPPTPFVVVDLDVARARYDALRQALPSASSIYAWA
jgi:ornithine decarboxylase